MKKLVAVCLLLSVAGISNIAFSQTSAVSNTDADAIVDVFTPISITNLQAALDFGDILSDQTTDESVDPTTQTSQSAQWRVDGSTFAGTTVNLSFTLPTQLENSNTDQIPITFGSGDAVWNSTNSVSGGTTFDPGNPSPEGENIDLSTGTSGSIWVWLGGTLQVSSVTNPIPEGNYTGDITFTADYGF